MSKQIPAVGYVRCSTEQQDDSPEQQQKAILSFAETKGYDVQEWFTDFGKSGTTFDQRPAFQQLRQAVEGNPPFQAVICYDESRWGRPIDPEESTYWRFYFRQRGVDVVPVITSIDPKSEFAPMLKSFESIQASQYSKKLSELTLRGGMNNKEYSNGGTAPYGYKRVAVNLKDGSKRDLDDAQWSVHKQEKVKWELGDPNEVDIVKLIYKLRLEGKAYVLIAEVLNLQGVPCPKRGRWRNKDQKWSGSTIKTMLENPVYYGARAYNRLSMSKIIAQKKGKPLSHGIQRPYYRNPPEEWNIKENAHPEIVSYEAWKQVNEATERERGTKHNQHTIRSSYLLTGLMTCSRCGFAFQGWSSMRKGHKYTKYLCGGYANKRACDYCAFHCAPIEEFAIEAIKETLNETLVSGKIEEYLAKLMDVDPKQTAVIKDRIKKAWEENDRKRKNLAEAIALGVNTNAIKTLMEKLEQLETEAVALKKQSALDQKTDALEIEVEFHVEAVKRFIADFDNAITNATDDVKKTILKKCISGIVVDREEKVLKFDIRKIPAVTPELLNRYSTRKPLKTSIASVVSAACSGGRQCCGTEDALSNGLRSERTSTDSSNLVSV